MIKGEKAFRGPKRNLKRKNTLFSTVRNRAEEEEFHCLVYLVLNLVFLFKSLPE